MTLLIAILLMQLTGVTDPWAYVGACLLWIFHISYHAESSSHKCRFK